MLRIELKEFQESGPISLSLEEYQFLKESHGTHLDLFRRGTSYIIKPRSFVGFIQLGNRILYIKPKIPDENLLYILSYLYDQIELSDEVDFSKLKSCSLLDLLALILTVWTNKLIKKGLFRRYVRKEEQICRVRGKVIPIRNLLRQDRIYCVFDELSHSVHENIILKATLRLLLSLEVMDEIKNNLRVLIKLLSEIDDVVLEEKLFQRICLTRLNNYYAKIIDLCHLIFNQSSVHQSEGNVKFQGFMVNMNEIFEEFLRRFLRNSFPNKIVGKRKISDWAYSSDGAYLPVIEPDIVIADKLILDAKYYKSPLGGNNKLHSDHLYQILAYMKVMNLDGILVYPEIDLGLDLEYEIDGKIFRIKTVNFGGSREEFEAELMRFRDYVSKIIYGDNKTIYNAWTLVQ